MEIGLKRAYDRPSVADGARILVDRLWPRGITKQAAHLDAWLKDLAPSNDLRRWFHLRPAQWLMFRKRYLQELAAPAATEQLQQLYDLTRRRKKVTLVFASENADRNNAVVLKELLEGMRKPPHSSGPVRAAAAGRVRQRMPRSR